MVDHNGNVSTALFFVVIILGIVGTWGPRNQALTLGCLIGTAAIVLFATGVGGMATGNFFPFAIFAVFVLYTGVLLFYKKKG